METEFTVKIQSWYEVSELQNGVDGKGDELDRIPGCMHWPAKKKWQYGFKYGINTSGVRLVG